MLYIGIRDMALSEKLQLDAKLTLEKAKRTIRQREAVHKHQGVFKLMAIAKVALMQITVDAIQQAKKLRKPVRAKKPERGSLAPAPKQCACCTRERLPQAR